MRVRVVLITLLVCIATSAWAKPKVAIPPFEDDDDGSVRDGVAAALEGEDFKILGKRETKRAADKFDLTTISDKSAKKLAEELGADVLVLGSVGTKAGKSSLKVRLFVSGHKAKGFSISFSNPKSAKFSKAFHDTMVSKVDSAGDAGGGDDDTGDDDSGDDDGGKPKTHKPKHGDDGDDGDDNGGDGDDDDGGKPKTHKPKHGDDDDGDDNGDDGDGDKGDGDDGDDDDGGKHGKKHGKKHGGKHAKECEDEDDEACMEDSGGGDDDDTTLQRMPNRAGIRLDIGTLAANRAFNLNSRANFPEGPKDYRNSIVPSAHIELEVYPLAFSQPHSVAGGLGFWVDYDKTLKLNVATTAEPGVKLTANQQRFSGGLKFRVVAGHMPTSPSFTFGVGYGRRKFKIDRTPLMDPVDLRIPDTDYHSILPSVSVRIPFVAAVALVGGADAMLVRNAGPVQLATQYGKAKILGVEAFGGLDFVFTKNIGFRVIGTFAQIGYTFIGAGGEIVNNLDGDPTTKDIGGAQDRSIGVAGTLAVMY